MHLRMSAVRAALKSSAPSSSSAYWRRDSATAVFSTILALAMDMDDPTIRNSNLFPVNAKGDVLLRSVASCGKRGSTCTPTFMSRFSPALYSSPFSMASSIAESSSPRNMETIAGGASAMPRRWSFPADATDTRSNAW